MNIFLSGDCSSGCMSTSSSSSWEKVLDSIVGYREVGHGARSSQLLEVWYYLWLKEKKEQGKKAQGGGVGGFLGPRELRLSLRWRAELAENGNSRRKGWYLPEVHF
ncbi:hypothetical protein HYE68_005701 [Fusarium pseudograminearum]|nr:hypothetical protein HYE68_005701 [Fusarium pseudograminearum]